MVMNERLRLKRNRMSVAAAVARQADDQVRIAGVTRQAKATAAMGLITDSWSERIGEQVGAAVGAADGWCGSAAQVGWLEER